VVSDRKDRAVRGSVFPGTKKVIAKVVIIHGKKGFFFSNFVDSKVW
jgi:hypothetical protein